jgi:GT2 family glycosyltransferase
VWVVDNASIDGSSQLVQEQFPLARVIPNCENVGFARANNQAIQQSTGRYILLLNPDTRVMPGALEKLVEYLDAHPAVGAAGSRLLNPDGSLQVSGFPFPTLGRELWRLFHLDVLRPYALYDKQSWDLIRPREVDVLQGASLALRREALNQIGLLDESYFIYSEEVDLCYRLRQAGWRLHWLPQSTVVHYGGQSTQQAATRMFLYLYQTKLQYFRKHHGPRSVRVYKLILLAASLVRLGLSPLAWVEPASRREQHLKLARNYMHLLRSLPDL